MKRLTYALSLLIVAAFFSCEEQDIAPGQVTEPTATTTQHRSSSLHRPITDPDDDPEFDAEDIEDVEITDPDDDPEFDADERPRKIGTNSNLFK